MESTIFIFNPKLESSLPADGHTLFTGLGGDIDWLPYSVLPAKMRGSYLRFYSKYGEAATWVMCPIITRGNGVRSVTYTPEMVMVVGRHPFLREEPS